MRHSFPEATPIQMCSKTDSGQRVLEVADAARYPCLSSQGPITWLWICAEPCPALMSSQFALIPGWGLTLNHKVCMGGQRDHCPWCLAFVEIILGRYWGRWHRPWEVLEEMIFRLRQYQEQGKHMYSHWFFFNLVLCNRTGKRNKSHKDWKRCKIVLISEWHNCDHRKANGIYN